MIPINSGRLTLPNCSHHRTSAFSLTIGPSRCDRGRQFHGCGSYVRYQNFDVDDLDGMDSVIRILKWEGSVTMREYTDNDEG